MQLLVKLSLTFTKFVEEKNDISGSFFFYAGVNKDKFPNDGNAPVKVSVNNKVKFDGTVKVGLSEKVNGILLSNLVGIMEITRA